MSAICNTTGKQVSIEKEYSQKDVADYLRKFLSPVMSADSLARAPWGNEENRRLYVAIASLTDNCGGIAAVTKSAKSQA